MTGKKKLFFTKDKLTEFVVSAVKTNSNNVDKINEQIPNFIKIRISVAF